MRTHTTIAGLALTLLMPLSAIAYATPEEVLSELDGTRFTMPPPSPREAEARSREQQERSNAEREARWQEAYGSQHSAASEEGESDADPTDIESLLNAVQQQLSELQEAQESPEALRQARLLQRIEAQQVQHGAAPTAQTLHSGAPLSHTGPETIIAVWLLLGAVCWTIVRARKATIVQD